MLILHISYIVMFIDIKVYRSVVTIFQSRCRFHRTSILSSIIYRQSCPAS